MRTQLQYDCRRDDAHEQHTKYQVSGMSPKLRLGLREEAQFEEDLLELTPFLRSFARALSQNQETAQDLTQETLLRAWQARATFKAGTNLKGWLCVILRNKFYSDFRRTRREVDWDQEEVSSIACWRSEQAGAIDLSDTVRALRCLSDEQREALILVGAGGFSGKDAAEICNCAVGTIKSRVTRARQSLSAILERESLLPSRSHSQALRATDEIMVELARLAAGSGRVGLITAPKNRGRHARSLNRPPRIAFPSSKTNPSPHDGVRSRSVGPPMAVLAAGPPTPPGGPQLSEIKERRQWLEHDEQTPDAATRGQRNRKDR